MKVVNVGTYDIIIGSDLLKKANDYIEEVLPSSKNKKCFIITDTNIDKLEYSDILTKSLKNYQVEKVVIEAGEESKSFSVFKNVAEKILESGLTRSDFLIALGGGVVGDLTGFLASTLLRGVAFVQIPTTLLAQVDSSIGGKTAINTKFGKNLIGTFYQPALVLIDTNTLKTLDERNLKSGYAETVKYGLLFDKKFFEYCEKHGKDCLNLDLDVCEKMIEASCQFKADIVKKDPFEKKGLRVLLNLGHTFGHVYEKLVNFNPDKVLHGEAVALGMKEAFIVSEKLSLIKHSEVERVLKHFKDLQLFDYSDLEKFKEFQDIKDFKQYMLENMKKDKKAEHGQYNLVLNKDIGEAVFVRGVDLKNIDF